MNGLDQREQSIKDMIAEAKAGREQADKTLAAYEQKMQAAAVEAHALYLNDYFSCFLPFLSPIFCFFQCLFYRVKTQVSQLLISPSGILK